MDLTSDHAFWTLKNGLQKNYPPLDGDLKCDVAVLGAGISGALVADALSVGGHSVAVFDKRERTAARRVGRRQKSRRLTTSRQGEARAPFTIHLIDGKIEEERTYTRSADSKRSPG